MIEKQVGPDEIVMALACCGQPGCTRPECGALVIAASASSKLCPLMVPLANAKEMASLQKNAAAAATGARRPVHLVHYRRVAVIAVVQPLQGGEG